MFTMRNLSIKRKLTAIIMLTSSIILLLASMVNVATELVTFRHSLEDSASSLAEMVGINCAAALTFNDQKAAEEMLRALTAVEGVLCAHVYTKDGDMFAEYNNGLHGKPQVVHHHEMSGRLRTGLDYDSGKRSTSFFADYVEIVKPILLDGDTIGVVYLQSDMKKLYARLKKYGVLILATLVGFSFISYLLSSILQRAISNPISELARSMSLVSSSKDYSVRVKKGGEDELGVLIDGFNEMLGQIQERDQELEKHRFDLEAKVALRTEELSKSNADLEKTVAELHLAKDAAEAASRAKSQFLANMSHEIRTPMNGVLGMTELLLATGLNDKQHNLAETVLHSGEALLTVLNDILDYSKIEAGKLELENINFDLRESVEEVMQLFAERAHQKNLELVCLLKDDVPVSLQGDPGRLRQILTNLIGNAIKFTERGEVFVRVSAVENKGEYGRLCFEVRDTGIGIPSETQEHIFEAFSQADGTTTRKYGGTGLGLAICKQLCEMMGGEIGLESSPGNGSVFRFTVRMRIRPTYAQSGVALHGDLKGKRVLIVDDNVTNRNILHHQVLSWGMQNGCAENGQVALEMLRNAAARGEPYELAILDMMMPEMSGLELAWAIKEDISIASVKLIMLTSVSQDYDSEVMLRNGISAYLTKPVRQSRLFNCISSVVGTAAAGEPWPELESMIEEEPRTSLGAHVLLAEDNPVNQEVARCMLESLGCRVEVVFNGREALEVISSSSFDVVLMDCQMPELDGYAATRIIRERERQEAKDAARQGWGIRRTPIIALTAHAMQGDREECLAAGMDDYLSKPFNRNRLYNVLRHWLAPKTPSDFSVDADLIRGNVGEAEGLQVQSKTNQCESRVDQGSPMSLEDLLERLSLMDSLDRKVLESLRAIAKNGQPGLLQKTIRIFTGTSPKLIEALGRAVAAEDASAMQEVAHSLKSAGGNLGALRLVELCKELENIGKTGATEHAPSLHSALEAEYETVCKALGEELWETWAQKILVS